MPIEFPCPGCQRTLRTPDGSVGKQARCPECGTIQVVPRPQGMPDAAAPSGQEAGGGTSGSLEGSYRSAPGYPFQGPYGATISDVQAYAASRVAGPATGLIVLGALALALQVLGLLAVLGGRGLDPDVIRANGGDETLVLLTTGVPGTVVQLVGTVVSLLVLLGAIRMKRLESYGFATLSAVLAMIPCISPCCLVGFPFGLWALIVLQDPFIRSAFRG